MNKKKLIRELKNEMVYLKRKGVPDHVIKEAFREALNEFDFNDITKFGSDAVSTVKDLGSNIFDIGKRGLEGISSFNLPDVIQNTTGLAKSIGVGVGETLKKKIAKYILVRLNISPDTFLALVLTNFFANLSFTDYKKVFKDCNFTCNLMAESLVDALIEQMRIKFNFDSISWSIVQDVIMDKLKQTDTIKDISIKLNNYVCPHLQDIRNMITKKASWAETFI